VDSVPEGYQRVVDTYHALWKAKKGPAAPFPWAKREGDAAKKLLRGHGLDVALAALAGAGSNPRWDGSFFAVANDPARWIGNADSASSELTLDELEQARALLAANPDHPVAVTLRAASQNGLKKAVPTRRQFEWLMAQPAAGQRPRRHARPQAAAFKVHEAWGED
jgi:hypothetical protein